MANFLEDFEESLKHLKSEIADLEDDPDGYLYYYDDEDIKKKIQNCFKTAIDEVGNIYQLIINSYDH